MSLKITINAAELSKQFKEFASEVQKDLENGVKVLAASTHAKTIEMAQAELHSSRDTFLDNLKYEEMAPGVYVITVLDKGFWVEEGLPEGFDMKPGLLNSPKAKMGKNGNKYTVVPFSHTKAPSRMTAVAKDIVNQIKTNLKKENVPFKKLELNSDGSPRMGKLHSFSWGGDKLGKGTTGSLERVSIYQSPKVGGGTRRDIFTFRTVSSSPASRDKWHHPGLEGKKFLDKAADFAMAIWENQILPEITKKWEMK
jgi:hypothetical protein